MKKLLICVVVIAMMLSSVAFAIESAYVNHDGELTVNTDAKISVIKTDALKVETQQTNTNSKIALVADPIGNNGKVVKITNPAYASANAAGAKVVSTFMDTVDGKTGTASNVSFGFSFYAPAAVENTTSDIYFNVNLKYKGGSTTEDITIAQVKSGKLYPYVERDLANKTAEIVLGKKWYDLRFDFNLGNRSIKTYVDNTLLYTSFFSEDVVNYLRYVTIATTVDSTCSKSQEVYFDNFFVNKTPECFNTVEYSKCIMNEDFSGHSIAKYNAFNSNNGGATAEVVDGVAKFTYPGAVTSSVPSMASKSVSSKGTGDYVDGEYMFEIDMKFSNFDGVTKIGYIKYNVSGNTSTDYDSHPAVQIANGGMLQVGGNNNYQNVEQLSADKWYNFKFHYKAREVANGKNKGLLADVYFQDNLVGENIYITNTNSNADKFVNTIRAINFQVGTATGPRIIYADNARYYSVNKVKIDPVQIVDVEVGDASGDFISTSYGEGAKTITAYVTSVSDLEAGSVTLLAARYESANGRLVGVQAIPAGRITKNTLTKITANLNVTDMNSGEFIKVMIVDSTNTLTPYIKPVTLSAAQ